MTPRSLNHCRRGRAAIGVIICAVIPHVYQVRMKLEDCVHCPDVDVLSATCIADKEVVEIFVCLGPKESLQV